MTSKAPAERLVVHEVEIRGDGLALTLGVGDYERSPTGEVWDDNWLRGSAEVRIEQAPTATFRATCDVAWQTTQLHAFHKSLRALLADLTGTARLATIEGQVEVTIELKAGKGLMGRVEAHAIAALEFEASTDQSFLAHTLQTLRAVVANTPIAAEGLDSTAGGRVAIQSRAAAESPTTTAMSRGFSPTVSTGSPGTVNPGYACRIRSFCGCIVCDKRDTACRLMIGEDTRSSSRLSHKARFRPRRRRRLRDGPEFHRM